MVNSLILLLCTTATALGQVPIPTRLPGFVYNNGSADAPIQWEAFVDLECPDGKAAYPVFTEVADYFGGDYVRLVIHPFPMPFHRNAFLAATGAHIASSTQKDPVSALKAVTSWIQVLYAYQDFWNTDATANITQVQIISLLSSYADKIGLSSSYFEAAFNNGTGSYDARIEWKYASTRGVAACPWSILNGITVMGADASWTFDQWKELIASLLGQNNWKRFY